MYSNTSSMNSSKDGATPEAFAHVDDNAEDEIQEIERVSESSPPQSIRIGSPPQALRPHIDRAPPSLAGGSRASSRISSRAVSRVQSNRSEAGGNTSPLARQQSKGSRTSSITRQKRRSLSAAGVLDRPVPAQTNDQTSANSAKTRWVKATWFAIQEAQRRKEAQTFEPQLEEEEEEEVTGWARVRLAVRSAVKSRGFEGWMILLTVYALFVPDIYLLSAESPAGDPALYWTTCAVFVLFVLELPLKSIAFSGYLCSFFFLLDFVAAVSFIPDVVWVFSDTDIISGVAGLNVTRASRAARIAVRVTRIVRVARLLLRFKVTGTSSREAAEKHSTFHMSRIPSDASQIGRAHV